MNIQNVLPAVPADRGPEGSVGVLSPAAPRLKQAQAGAGAPAENGSGKRAGRPDRLHLSGESLCLQGAAALHCMLLCYDGKPCCSVMRFILS